jgi:diacylglycerol O-acyltransferase
MVTRIVAPHKWPKSPAGQGRRQEEGQVPRGRRGMLGLTGERMTKVDTAWLRMDSPSNLMMIVGVWVLKPGIKYADLCQRVAGAAAEIPRFRQRW